MSVILDKVNSNYNSEVNIDINQINEKLSYLKDQLTTLSQAFFSSKQFLVGSHLYGTLYDVKALVNQCQSFGKQIEAINLHDPGAAVGNVVIGLWEVVRKTNALASTLLAFATFVENQRPHILPISPLRQFVMQQVATISPFSNLYALGKTVVSLTKHTQELIALNQELNNIRNSEAGIVYFQLPAEARMPEAMPAGLEQQLADFEEKKRAVGMDILETTYYAASVAIFSIGFFSGAAAPLVPLLPMIKQVSYLSGQALELAAFIKNVNTAHTVITNAIQEYHENQEANIIVI